MALSKILAIAALAQLSSVAALETERASPPSSLVPVLSGKSSYVSTQANEYGIRTRLDVIGTNFIIKAVGHSPEAGRGSHDGGAIFVKDEGDHFHLGGIGISLPKPSVNRWREGNLLTCDRLPMSDDVYSVSCTRSDDKTRFGGVFSTTRGVLSFTGFCWMMENRSCEYVLISDRGIAHR